MPAKHEKPRQVVLVPYDKQWPLLFAQEEQQLAAILKQRCLAIHHIGSTAIPQIHAKPIIDILPVVDDIEKIDALNPHFEALGYTCMGEYGIKGRRFFWKSKSQRSHNIHIFSQNSPEIARHLAFRDFLINNPVYAQAYSLIKQSLAAVFVDDIENYVNGKASFIQYIDYKTGQCSQEQLDADDHIVISAYNPAWPLLAKAEIDTITESSKALDFVVIEHIGSTAVPELSSKPIIDLFITIQSLDQAPQWIELLETLGYVFWPENPDKTHLRFFKGMPPFGKGRTHHIHLMEASTSSMEHRLLFRDILRLDGQIRRDYEKLKQQLANEHSGDREYYTDAKSLFITQVLRTHGYEKPISR